MSKQFTVNSLQFRQKAAQLSTVNCKLTTKTLKGVF